MDTYLNFLNENNKEKDDKKETVKDFLSYWKDIFKSGDIDSLSGITVDPPKKKRMVTVYTTLDEVPKDYREIIDELLNNCNNKKLNKVGGKYYYGDYQTKLSAYKIGEKGYLGLTEYEPGKIRDKEYLLPKRDDRIRVYDEIYELVKDTIKQKLEKIDRITRIRNHYDAKKGGSIGYDEDDAVKVGWNNREQQEKRWDILLNIGFQDGDSILDFGCGIGDLYGYMEEKYKKFIYYGVEVNQEYYDIARKKYPNVNFKLIDNINEINFNYDWFVASGVFTVYTTTEDLIRYIDAAYQQCNKGVAFNLIKELYYPNVNDPLEKRRGYNSKEILSIFKEKYDSVRMVDKYLKPNKDFTIYIYK